LQPAGLKVCPAVLGKPRSKPKSEQPPPILGETKPLFISFYLLKILPDEK
jgi:hypothetical protein